MKTITATKTGVAINYHDTGKSSFIPYQFNEEAPSPNRKSKYLELNIIQKSMFRRLMYGIKAYTPQEVSSMDEKLVFTIEKEHLRATQVLNKHKYEKHYAAYNKLLSVIFPHIELNYFKDGQYVDIPTMKELKITTYDIIVLWIDNKLLPSNFFNLDVHTIQL